MDLEQHLLSHFNHHSSALQQLAETQLYAVIDASQIVAHALINERKVISCGNGTAAALAQLFAAQLLGRCELERPALPALALGADTTTLTALAGDFGFSEVYASAVRALGQPGDVLLAISSASAGSGPGKGSSLIQAVRAAHEREMLVVLLDGASGGDAGALLTPEDVLIEVEGATRALTAEIQFMVLNGICNLVEQQLFGSAEGH